LLSKQQKEVSAPSSSPSIAWASISLIGSLPNRVGWQTTTHTNPIVMSVSVRACALRYCAKLCVFPPETGSNQRHQATSAGNFFSEFRTFAIGFNAYSNVEFEKSLV
jgi:hypothetical protein